MELTRAQKRLIYRNPDLGTYRFNPPPVSCVNWLEDDWLDFIPTWIPNEEFWKQQARWWIDDQYMWDYCNATELAENCADSLDHHEWLDDPDHWIWEIAMEYFNGQ